VLARHRYYFFNRQELRSQPGIIRTKQIPRPLAIPQSASHRNIITHEHLKDWCNVSVARAIKSGWNDVEIFEIVQPVIQLRHQKWRWCWWFFGENVSNFVNIESNGVNQLCKQIQRCCICFEVAEVTAADSNIALCTIRCEFNRQSNGGHQTGNT